MKRYCAPLFCLFILMGALSLEGVRITETEVDGHPVFLIETDRATYHYRIRSGGFASILDRDGNDWVSHKTRLEDPYPEGAASRFRGLPNMVFGSEDNGAGHPAFERCLSILVDERTIRSFSISGKWQWSWQFSEADAVLTVEEADPDHPYWFLYEGPIAGTFRPDRQYWGTSRKGPVFEFPDYLKGETEFDQWDWAYFGDRAYERVFFVQQLTPDRIPDCFGYLGNTREGLASPDGMVVFGFGRYERAAPQMTRVPQKFRIGFIEQAITDEAAHQQLAENMAAAIESGN